MAHTAQSGSPETWGASKQSTLSSWWQSTIGQAMRQLCPASWPGVPVAAFMGFIANSGSWDERTSIDERGLFGTEGPKWDSMRARPEVTSLLGRTAVGDPDWMGSRGGVYDQVALGLVDLHDHLNEVSAKLDASIRPASTRSQWAVMLAFMGWSAGSNGAANHIRPYTTELAAVPEASRWGAFSWFLARDYASGSRTPGTAGSHSNPAYSAVRTFQKLAAGRLFARVSGEDAAWFDTCLGGTEGWVEAVLANAGYSGSVARETPPAAPPLNCTGSALAGLVDLGGGTLGGLSTGAQVALAVGAVAVVAGLTWLVVSELLDEPVAAAPPWPQASPAYPALQGYPAPGWGYASQPPWGSR
jgi:hypothetical protein